MTSKISFSKLVRSELHQLNWLTAVWSLLFGLLIPFRVLMMMAMRGSYRINETTPIEEFSRHVGLGHMENEVIILIAGGVCALAAFSYLHSSVKLDLYQSLALRRERLFAVRYISGALSFALPYLISQVLAALIGIFYGAMSAQLLLEMTVSCVQGVLFFLCSYSSVLLAVMLTGKTLTAIFATGVMGLYVPAVYVLYVGMRQTFMETSIWVYYGSDNVLKCSSPWAFCLSKPVQQGREGITGYIPTLGELCQLLALAAVLTAVCVALYRVRKTEVAGSALAFRRTEGIVKLLICVPTAICAGWLANELFDSILWEVVFIVLFGTLACLIMEFIYRWDIRQVFGRKRYLAATLICAVALFFPIRFDWMGYNTYLPDKEELAAMSVMDLHFNISYPEATDTYTWEDDSIIKLLDYMETADFDGLYELARSGVENAGRDTWNGDFTYTYLKFRTKDGKETYRCYWVDEELYLQVMDEMIQREEFRNKYFPVLSWSEEQDRTVTAHAALYASDGIEISRFYSKASEEDAAAEDSASFETENTENEYAEDEYAADESGYVTGTGASSEYGQNTVDMDISADVQGRVIEAYREDLQNVSWSEMWEAGSYLLLRPIGSSWEASAYPLCGSFENTLQVLEEISNM